MNMTIANKTFQKRIIESQANFGVTMLMNYRLSLIQTDEDQLRAQTDFLNILHQDSIKLIDEPNHIQSGKAVLGEIKKEVLRMEKKRELLEAKLKLAAQKGKQSATYKQLKSLSEEPRVAKREEIIDFISSMNPSLSEEILSDRRD
ncbi:hypothetical protein SAMN05444162_3619 [Paenibacillaceae bacterium GAS479]|nr:hypothetical protein SAMN05444162_3619 [Paenibacillaceae bacterium GAS479]